MKLKGQAKNTEKDGVIQNLRFWKEAAQGTCFHRSYDRHCLQVPALRFEASGYVLKFSMADWKVAEAERLHAWGPHRLSSCSASVCIDSMTNALQLLFCLHFLTGEMERQMGWLDVVVAHAFNTST